VKSRFLVVSIGSIFLTSLLFLSSCKKINEATELGDDLVPAVDNVHTFDVALNTNTNNVLFDDTTQIGLFDYVTLGDFNDPEFGHTHANACFNISPSAVGRYPFVKNDGNLKIDSVVLSLSYQSAYGDTVNDGIQTLHVYEIDPNAVNDTSFNKTFYKFSDPASDFATTGPELGSATFSIKNLKDTDTLVRAGDTTLVSNVVRIRLDNSIGNRFAQYDTINGPNGGFYSDSIFRALFRGFSVKADPTGNALSYFRLYDFTNTKLTVYFTYGTTDTSSFDFYHGVNGQSNYVNRENGGNYLAYLNSGAGDKIYLQSAPGSYANVVIPSLSTLGNKTIHRAELVAVKVPSAGDDVFSAPDQLMLDRKNGNTPDTVFMLEKDLVASSSGSIGFSAFGGFLKPDNTVRFNISRYVQGIITRHEANDTLRIYAPLRAKVFNSIYHNYLDIGVNSRIAHGRLVLGGGSNTDSTTQLRLRIIYSDL
jgi:hypothetical protein